MHLKFEHINHRQNCCLCSDWHFFQFDVYPSTIQTFEHITIILSTLVGISPQVPGLFHLSLQLKLFQSILKSYISNQISRLQLTTCNTFLIPYIYLRKLKKKLDKTRCEGHKVIRNTMREVISKHLDFIQFLIRSNILILKKRRAQ